MTRLRSGSELICEPPGSPCLLNHCAQAHTSDYKGLKKRITAVRREQSSARDRSGSSDNDEGDGHASSDPLTDAEPLVLAENTRLPPLPHSGDVVDDAEDEPSGTTAHGDSAGSGSEDPVKVDKSKTLDPEVRHLTVFIRLRSLSIVSRLFLRLQLPDRRRIREEDLVSANGRTLKVHSLQHVFLPSLTSRLVPRFLRREPRSSADEVPMTLEMLMAPMSPAQRAFVEKLDREHDKVESFYLAREKEARTQASRLRMELNELKQHRALFHVRITPL